MAMLRNNITYKSPSTVCLFYKELVVTYQSDYFAIAINRILTKHFLENYYTCIFDLLGYEFDKLFVR